jgi:hypothetical protein
VSSGSRLLPATDYNVPVHSPLVGRNIPLLLKLLRGVILNLNPMTAGQQKIFLDRTWQGTMNFHTFVAHYLERYKIILSMTYGYDESYLVEHFLQRVNGTVHEAPLNALYARDQLPPLDQCIQFIMSTMSRNKARKLEYVATMNGTTSSSRGEVKGESRATFAAESGSRREPSRACSICGDWHWDTDCPNNHSGISNKLSRPCKHCQGNHKDNDCKKKDQKSGSGKSGDEKVWCDLCKNDKHKTKNCPYMKQARKAALTSKEDTGGKSCEKPISKAHAVKSLAKVFSTSGLSKDDMLDAIKEAGAEYFTNRSANSTTSSFINKKNKSKDCMFKVKLDNCSQEHVATSKLMLGNIKGCKKDIVLTGITGPGSSVVSSQGCGDFCGLEMYYIPQATTNLISEGRLVSDGYRVVTDPRTGSKTVFSPGETILDEMGNVADVIDSNEIIFVAEYVDFMMTITYYKGVQVNSECFWSCAKTDKKRVKKTTQPQKKPKKSSSDQFDYFEGIAADDFFVYPSEKTSDKVNGPLRNSNKSWETMVNETFNRDPPRKISGMDLLTDHTKHVMEEVDRKEAVDKELAEFYELLQQSCFRDFENFEDTAESNILDLNPSELPPTNSEWEDVRKDQETTSNPKPDQNAISETYQPLESDKVMMEALASNTKLNVRFKPTLELYKCLGRPPIDKFKYELSQGTLRGTEVTAQDVETFQDLLDIEGVRAIATSTRQDSDHSNTPLVNKVGELLHCDVFYDAYKRPYLFAVDRACGLKTIVPLKTKRLNEMFSAFKTIVITFKSYGHEVKQFVSDNEKVFNSAKSFLGNIGILMTFTPSGQHDQIAERATRTVKEKVNILKGGLDYELPEKLEYKAIEFAIYLLNRLSITQTAPKSPWEVFSGTNFNLKLNPLIPFGQVGVFHKDKSLRKVKDQRGQLGIFVGKRPDIPKGYEVFLPSSSTIVIRYGRWTPAVAPKEWKLNVNPIRSAKSPLYNPFSIIYDLNYTDAELDPSDLEINSTSDKNVSKKYIDDTNVSGDNYVLGDNYVVGNTDEDIGNENVDIVDLIDPKDSLVDDLNGPFARDLIDEAELYWVDPFLGQDQVSENVLSCFSEHDNNLKEKEENYLRKGKLSDFLVLTAEDRINRVMVNEEKLLQSTLDQIFTLDGDRLDVDWANALASMTFDKDESHLEAGQKAIYDELKQMYDKGVMTTVLYYDIPTEHKKKIIQSIIFLKDKFKADGTFDKVKARLVAMGNMQISNIFTEKTDSPTANLLSIMVLLCLAASLAWHVIVADFAGAYLNAFLELGDSIYMALPKKTIEIWLEITGESRHNVMSRNGRLYVKLNKALYGLKQSAMLWFQTIAAFLRAMGYQQLGSDQCVFYRRDNKDGMLILALYVDDVLLISNREYMMENFLSDMTRQYGDMSVQRGDKISFLSMSITIDNNRGTINVDQNVYIKKCITEFETAHGTLTKSTYPVNLDIFVEDRGDKSLLSDKQSLDYLSLVMTLMFAAIRTRPDILLGVTFLATKVKSPTKRDWNDLTRIFGYLKASPEFSLSFQRGQGCRLEIYADASFKVHDDTCGHSGMIIKLFGNLIYFKSGKQKLVTKSSTEAELIALDDAATYSAWLRTFLSEVNLSPDGPTIIYQDNKSTMVMAENGRGEFKRTKHIANRFYWVKQFIDGNEVVLIYLPTDDMLADFMTKAIKGKKFWTFLGQINNFKIYQIVDETEKDQISDLE